MTSNSAAHQATHATKRGRDRSRAPRVLVLDPNSVNAYGAELARVIAAAGAQVTWWGTRAAPLGLPATVARSSALGGERQTGGVATVVQRLISPVKAAWMGRGQITVVAWARDPWYCLVLAAAARSGNPTVVIHHNPVGSRRRDFIDRLAESQLLAASRVVVHSQRLAELASTLPHRGEIVVAPHPAYQGAAMAQPARDVRQPRVLFVGGLRPDKGADVLLQVLAASTSQFTFVTVGKDALTESQREHLATLGKGYEAIGNGRFATDEELAAELSKASVVLAPYTDVTESGSVLMCLSVGVPVVGLRSGSLSTHLVPEALAHNPTELAAVLDRFLASPFETFRNNAQAQDEQSVAAWRSIVASMSPAGRQPR